MEKEGGKTTKPAIYKTKPLSGSVIPNQSIRSLIYVVRGQQVMMDHDLAALYQVETRVFNQAVKRNENRFPDAFRFQMTVEEYEGLRSQFVTSNGRGGRRYMPYVFTEQGIAMLSAVLSSDIAIQMSIRIMTEFVEMRKFLINNYLLFEKINEVDLRQQKFEKKTDERFERVFDYIAENGDTRQKIFFDGQIYDAFSLLVNIVSGAKKSIILIDNYVDTGTLNILSKKNMDVKVCIYTHRKTKLSNLDVVLFNSQYPKLEVRHTEKFHDRFLIIDRIQAYHIGASLKDAGKKCFAINQLEDKRIVNDILQRLVLD